MQELTKHGATFRVLALSATPGSDLKGIQQVVRNLQISRVEYRNEESPDIVPYIHSRNIQKEVHQFCKFELIFNSNSCGFTCNPCRRIPVLFLFVTERLRPFDNWMNDYDLELFIEFIELISGPQKER